MPHGPPSHHTKRSLFLDTIDAFKVVASLFKITTFVLHHYLSWPTLRRPYPGGKQDQDASRIVKQYAKLPNMLATQCSSAIAEPRACQQSAASSVYQRVQQPERRRSTASRGAHAGPALLQPSAATAQASSAIEGEHAGAARSLGQADHFQVASRCSRPCDEGRTWEQGLGIKDEGLASRSGGPLPGGQRVQQAVRRRRARWRARRRQPQPRVLRAGQRGAHAVVHAPARAP